MNTATDITKKVKFSEENYRVLLKYRGFFDNGFENKTETEYLKVAINSILGEYFNSGMFKDKISLD